MYNGNNTSYRPYTKIFFLFPLRALGTYLGNHKSIVDYSIYGPFIVIWRFCGLLYARVTEMKCVCCLTSPNYITVTTEDIHLYYCVVGCVHPTFAPNKY